MTRLRVAHRIAPLLPVLTFPAGASGQTATGNASNQVPSSSSWGGSIAILAVMLVLLLAVGATVKLYDLKRKREDEALMAQSHVSDALLLDRALTGLPITAVATGSRWRRSPLVIAIAGSVPTPELRDSVMRLVEQELSRRHPGARAEDRLMVDPLVGQERARSSVG